MPPHGRQTARMLAPQSASTRPTAAPSDCNQQALGAQLAHEPPAGGTEGEARGNFPLPGGAAREQQVRDVDAGDDQHERRASHQDEQRLRIAPSRVHQPLAARLGAQRRRILHRPAGVGAARRALPPAPDATPRALPAASGRQVGDGLLTGQPRPETAHHLHPQERGTREIERRLRAAARRRTAA